MIVLRMFIIGVILVCVFPDALCQELRQPIFLENIFGPTQILSCI